ncbi:MAG: Membrane-bound dehydrogenase domain protein [Pedosphaera sp.]|nr:Membrane-bound dehydrogenase domain protein [Pedosphaera sp.]
MFVAEMRSYMQDIDGSNENSKVGRVSMHWSSKGDGVFDKHTVFIDNLNLPRMILPMDGGILVNETDTEDIYLYRDTDGDGVADKKELWHAGGPRGGNLEHQPSGLVWDLDNWIYMAVNGFRLRMQGTNVVSEPTGANLGQWGLSQDDYGKPWFVNAGYEAGPLNFEMPIVYGGYEPPEKFVPNFAEVWPLVTLGDYEGGQARLHPDKSLNHFTGTCGPDIYRGDHLPADLRGDLLFCEPVGRLIRRAKVDVKEAFTSLSNVYDKEHSEFIRSTDPNFRPVNIVTAPDGTIYIVDMYRGIIQEGNWVRPGTYLRGVVQQNELQKNFGRGRIWRLVYNGMKPGSQPHMLDEKPAQLVKHLESPNGWWRDTAQKLLILRANKSVVPALVKMARADSDHLARIHALWTLEGLDALEPEMIRAALKDKHPQVRIAGIRTSETLYKKGDSSLMAEILEMANDPDPNVVLQVLMTGNLLKWPEAQKVASATVTSNPAFGIKKMGVQLVQSAAPPQIPQEVSQQERSLLVRGGEIYQQLCFSCHGLDGKGTPLAGAAAGTTMAPSLAGGKVATGYRDGIINVVLKGLSGPLDGKTYTAQMVPMQSYDDAWIAAVTSFIRNNFGNSSSFVTPQDVARVRSTFAAKTDPWTANELAEVLPKPMADGWRWKISASHNEKSAKLAIDGDPKTRYDTHTAQAPGMWLEIKLPWKTNIAGLELDAGKAANSFPRKYKVELSTDGRNWGKPVATGHGTGKQTEIIFAPTEARYIRITQTGETPDHVWSVGELQVLKPASPWFHSTPTEAKKPSPSAFE